MSDVDAGIDQVVITEGFAASAVCDALEVSRSGFYAWRSEEESHRAAVDRELTPEIVDIFWHHRRRYGARRIAMELAQRGIACGVARVARLLKNQGLRAIQPESFAPRTTDSRHGLGYNENLLKVRKAPLRVNEMWVGDITYIATATGWLFLAVVIDLFSRRVVGWSMATLQHQSKPSRRSS